MFSKEWNMLETERFKVVYKENPNSILVKTYSGENRDRVKEYLEYRLGKRVLFLGELLCMTG